MNTKPKILYLTYAWLFCFGLFPIALVLVMSFLTQDNIYLASPPWTLGNYTTLISPLFAKVFLRSLFMALITTLSCLMFAYPFSYFLTKSKHQTLGLALIIIPFWTSSLVRTYSLIAILKCHGLLNSLLLACHLISAPLNFMYTNAAVLLGLIYNLFPFMVMPIFSNMERFDFSLIEAAQDLGANKWIIFCKVFLPGTYGGIMAGCLMVFLPSMTLFYIANILGGARSMLLGNLIQNEFLVAENWPQGAAISMALTLILIVMLYFYSPKKDIIH